jgi:hypothetical protein
MTDIKKADTKILKLFEEGQEPGSGQKAGLEIQEH